MTQASSPNSPLDLWYSECQDKGFGITLKVTGTLFSGQSDFQKVDIVETEAFGRMMLLDGLVMVTERDEFVYHEMISHIPLLSHPKPESVLVIGGGDGGTIREVLKHPSVKRAVLCEIDGMVIEAAKQYLPTMSSQLSDPRVEIQVADGVAYIAQQKQAFDIILIDSTDPLGPGEGLFTEAFYNNVKAALKPGGLVVAQSESPIANQPEIQKMYRLLHKVFPVVKPYVGPIPTYPGGYWSWAFCSQGELPTLLREEAAQTIEKTSQFYTRELHSAVFAVPNFLKKLIAEATQLEALQTVKA
jgi:spermidine synthase